MSFYKRYELVRLIGEGEAKTFSARENATGRTVVVHMLAPSATLGVDALLEIVEQAGRHPTVIEVGEFAGSYYIAVQESEGGIPDFRTWLASLAPATALKSVKLPPVAPAPKPTAPAPVAAKPATPQALPASGKPGEFTDMFGLAEFAEPEPAVLPLQAGEFTNIFRLDVPAPKPSAQVKAEPRPAVPSVVRETTQAPLPRAAGVPPPVVAKAMPRQAAPPVVRETTQAPLPRAAGVTPPVVGKATPPPLAPAKATKPLEPAKPPATPASIRPLPRTGDSEIGEFTRIFGRGTRSKPGVEDSGEFTGLFYKDGTPAPSAAHSAPAASVPGVSGEFAQFFGSAPQQEAARSSGAGIGEFAPVFEQPAEEPPKPAEPVDLGPSWPAMFPEPKGSPSLDAKAADQSDYAQFFGNGLPGEAIDVEREQARNLGVVEPTLKPFRQASEFTRVFGVGKNAAGPPPPPPSSYVPRPGDSVVSQIFKAPAFGGTGTGDPFAGAPGLGGNDSATDDFSRLIGARQNAYPQPGQGAPGQQQQSAGPVKGQGKRTGLIVVLIAIAVAVVGLLVYALLTISRK